MDSSSNKPDTSDTTIPGNLEEPVHSESTSP